MSPLSLILAGSAAGAWALTQVLMKSGLRHMDLVSFALTRLLIGVILVITLGLITSSLSFPGWRLTCIAASGGLIDSFVGTAFFLYAIRHTPAHLATSLANAAPVWGVIGAFLFLSEPLSWSAGLAAFLVAGGAWLLSRPEAGQPTSTKLRFVLAATFAGVCWGLAAAVPSKYCINAGMQPATVQVCMLTASSLGWGFVLLLTRSWRKRIWTRRGFQIAFMTAFTGYLVGWALWLRALSGESAVALSPIRGGGMTLFAFLLSIILFGERPHLRAYLGVVCVLAGIIVVSWLG